MLTQFQDRSIETRSPVRRFADHVATRAGAAILCLAVVAIHVKDQNGFPGDKAPRYVGIGYYLLEAGAVIAALLLLARVVKPGWVLAAAVAAGPLLGYVLSRGPGMPSYTDDRGNWTEPIGLLSLIVEGVLLVMALTAASGALRSAD